MLDLDLLAGRRRVGAVVNLTLIGVANAAAILTLSTFTAMVGIKTFKIKRLKIRNNGAGDTWVHIGTGAGGTFVNAIPPLRSISNTTDDYDEFDLPQVELSATITAYPVAVGGGSFDVQVEAEEIG
jgi:hypothetical protein